ncbi:hypothetical protein [Vulcaniibacterium gelatinicum]|nr:hypothetical protein [Vulcaniibacterium gelatinicum]
MTHFPPPAATLLPTQAPARARALTTTGTGTRWRGVWTGVSI